MAHTRICWRKAQGQPGLAVDSVPELTKENTRLWFWPADGFPLSVVFRGDRLREGCNFGGSDHLSRALPVDVIPGSLGLSQDLRNTDSFGQS